MRVYVTGRFMVTNAQNPLQPMYIYRQTSHGKLNIT